MKIEDPMILNFGTCRPTDTLGDAPQVMWHRDCDCVRVANHYESKRVAGVLLHVTLGDLVEAVASTTGDLGEQFLVLDHILRKRGAKSVLGRAGVVA